MPRPSNISLYDFATNMHKRFKKIKGLQDAEKHTVDELGIMEIPVCMSEIPIEIIFSQQDTVQVIAKDLADELQPLVLSQSDMTRACGNWDKYEDGYEEGLSYRSTLPMSLVDRDFPLKVDELIYCPSVCFFRDSGYNVLSKCLKVAVAAMSTVKRPDFSVENDKQKVYHKFEMLFTTAVLYNHSSIIMNAFGCDKDDNDATEVAKLLKQFIELYKFKIRRITVTFTATSNDANFLVFKKVINNCF